MGRTTTAVRPDRGLEEGCGECEQIKFQKRNGYIFFPKQPVLDDLLCVSLLLTMEGRGLGTQEVISYALHGCGLSLGPKTTLLDT